MVPSRHQTTHPSALNPDPTPANWYIVCSSRDLRSKPVAATLAGLPVVLFRDADDKAAAIEDRCAHRNAPLSEGSVIDGRLRCRYHGWEYDGSGQVASVPATRHDPACFSHIRIRSLPVVEQDGFVWAWLGERAPSSVPLPFPRHKERGWTSFVMKTRFQATVDACLENFLDCPHATFVHRYWFRAPTAKPVRATVRTLEDGVAAEFFDEPREKSLVWWGLAPAGGAMKHTDRFIAPSTSRVDYEFPGGLHYIITSSCTPISPRETEVYTVISFRYRKIGSLVRLFFEPLARWIIRQDAKMLSAQRRNIERFGAPAFQSTPADLLGPLIASWRRALAAGTAPPAPGHERHVEIYL